MNPENTPQTRPLSVAHLIFGLIFSGIAAVWLIGEANNTDVSNWARGIPVVLIGAGIIGLGAALYARRRSMLEYAAAQEPYEPTTTSEDTYVLNETSQEQQ